MIVWSLDTESFYSKEFSITNLGAWQYVFAPKAEHYLVSVAGSDGTRYVGSPEGAPWQQMQGGLWVSVNVGYDALVRRRLIQDGRIPDLPPSEWHDVADMWAYRGYPRALKLAVQARYGVPVSKDTRDKMKGKHWHAMTPEFQEEVKTYALSDADWPLKAWQDDSHLWPEHERRLSRLTREIGWRGVRIDADRVDRGIKQMQLLCWAAEQKIPWSDEAPALSYPRLVAECRKAGIEAPGSLAIGDEGCEYWEDKYTAKYPWVAAMRIKRRCNAMLKKLQTIRSRIREDGTVPTELKYCGGGLPGRWSGSGGINFQNLPREEFFGVEWWAKEGQPILGGLIPDVIEGVDLRACIIPREGNRFIAPDLSQIEPRVAALIVKDTKFIALLGEGHSPYDAHAVSTGMCQPSPISLKKSNPPLYQLAKARELALGYQAGHHKFIMMAPLYVSPEECERIFSAPVTEEQVKAYENYLLKLKIAAWTARWRRSDAKGKLALVNSWLIVQDYRRSRPKTVAMWKRLQIALQESAVKGENLDVVLQSGRTMTYRNVSVFEGDLTAVMPQFGKLARQKIYGGQVFNNIVQGTARDVFAECTLRVADAGHDIVMSVHDELVLDVPASVTPEEIHALMVQPPSFMPLLPVASEVPVLMAYTK